MDFIKRILLIFVLVLATFSFNEAKCASLSQASNIASISALKVFENDYINLKDNQVALSVLNPCQSEISLRRNNDNQNAASDNNSISVSKQFENLIIYIQNQVNLDGKNELALLLLLHQIQPNAP